MEPCDDFDNCTVRNKGNAPALPSTLLLFPYPSLSLLLTLLSIYRSSPTVTLTVRVHCYGYSCVYNSCRGLVVMLMSSS